MSQNPDNEKLKSLGERLEKARKPAEKEAKRKRAKSGKAFGQAYRIGIEMVIAIAVGGFIGWLLDRWLETPPIFMLIFFFLGVAAGFLNVYKAAEKMRADSPDERTD